MDAWRFITGSRWLLLLLGWLWITPLQALELVFVAQKPSDAISALVEQTSDRLQASRRLLTLEQDILSDSVGKPDLVVLIGPEALAQAALFPPDLPKLALLVTRADVQRNPSVDSAVYLEPPLVRQARLAHELVGQDRPLGVLAESESSLKQLCDCQQELARIEARIYFLDQYDSLNRALLDLLQRNEALIGVYDLSLYSAANIKNILITAYRQGRPLIGPSSAYIRAGALATTYSDLGHIVERVVDIVSEGRQGNWPAADYNPYFSVRYNQQVARSLNLILPDREELAKRLHAMEQP